MTITEGRNRQVRRMLEAVESKVLKLVRIAIGPIRIGDLPIGKWRNLTPEEVHALSGRASSKVIADRRAARKKGLLPARHGRVGNPPQDSIVPHES
jgi:23S rRNA pseudouridine2605 synthase